MEIIQMFLVCTRKQAFWFCGIVALLLGSLGYILYFLWLPYPLLPCSFTESDISKLIAQIVNRRNQAILKEEPGKLAQLYYRNRLHGLWAYEHQVKKLKYLHNWCHKQGAKLAAIHSMARIRRIQPRVDGVRIIFSATTEYRYFYSDEPSTMNSMRIGTCHSLDLSPGDPDWRIVREWYTDPFSDDLSLESKDITSNQAFIPFQKPRNFSYLEPRRIKAVQYADKYCGAFNFKYNPQYKNYNYQGGDCANFASQVLFEGGGFRKTRLWNYERDASRAWVNAQAFNQYMYNSGRAYRIAYGSYNKVLKESYRLLPGDYVAYERKGKVTHISVITGADTKGYALTNSHNTDRYRVPWDLGYGDKQIRFWLMRVFY
jgi:hypothetical protein